MKSRRPRDIPIRLWRDLEEAQEEARAEAAEALERKRERRAWDSWLRGKTRRLAVLERRVAKVVEARNRVLAEHAPPFAELEIAKARLQKRRRRRKKK